ncbi:MAG: hypothetical protein Q9224_002271 [Gallowayella concinna]
MSDPPEGKDKSIPDWQHDEAPRSPETHDRESHIAKAPHHVEPPSPRAALLEQASQFLAEEDIRDAPVERKIAFLQTKGLVNEEISGLLDLPKDRLRAGTQDIGTEETVSTVSSPPAQEQEAAPSQLPSQQSPPKDNPPIITYPEFLHHSQKHAPLVTASRLINALYLFTGTAAAVYGTSKFLVEPMVEGLTSARHSLASTTQTNLDTLNEKLEENVAINPSGISRQNLGTDDQNEEDMSDTTEDMAPLFNRTIGTQTSPPDSPSSSTSQAKTPSPPLDTISKQQSSLATLHTALASLNTPKDNTLTDDKLTDQIEDLKQYLNTLKYPNQHARTILESKDNAVNKFKTEIRGMKGLLLSTRNFPSGTTAGKGFGGRVGE